MSPPVFGSTPTFRTRQPDSRLDPRGGPRLAAWLTTLAPVLVLITGSGWLALRRAAVFALTGYRFGTGRTA